MSRATRSAWSSPSSPRAVAARPGDRSAHLRIPAARGARRPHQRRPAHRRRGLRSPSRRSGGCSRPASAEVVALPMLIVAAVGLAANVAAFLVLRGGDRAVAQPARRLPRGARRPARIDRRAGGGRRHPAHRLRQRPTRSPRSLIAALIVPRAVMLLRDVVRVLTESAPRDMNVEQIREHLLETPGRRRRARRARLGDHLGRTRVHRARRWSRPACSSAARPGCMLDRLGECLNGHFDVEHSTFQLEPAGHADREEHAHR